MPAAITERQRTEVLQFLTQIQDALAHQFELVDSEAKVVRTPWTRPQGGGGTMAVIRGGVVEKAGVNVSQVWGDSYPAIEKNHQDRPFRAMGVSTITHMYNPHAPIAHMNVRLIEVGDEFWVGGGADLTPFLAYEEDTELFHKSLKNACDGYDKGAYEAYRKWAQEYFYIPHRASERGVGGVFFDYLKGDFGRHFDLMRAVASAYVETYPQILQRRKTMDFTPEQKEAQLYWRGRYAEFNLAYDRGTRFGLMTGGNTDAIFVSLPPVVKW